MSEYKRPLIRDSLSEPKLVYTHLDPESLTKQEFKDECDINILLKRYETTGELPNMIRSNPQYGDFSQVGDFQAAQAVVLRANEQFYALSAHVRERFVNDPAKFLEFATNPQNSEELIKLGLASAALPQNTQAPGPPAVENRVSEGPNAKR